MNVIFPLHRLMPLLVLVLSFGPNVTGMLKPGLEQSRRENELYEEHIYNGSELPVNFRNC